MSLRVIGAGLGRTGTSSLKLALEKLLGGPCYHMMEVFPRPADIAVWHAAARGETVDWPALLAGFPATVDWPSCTFWAQQCEIFPDAVIVLSTRPSEAWWQSASKTIFPAMQTKHDEWRRMVDAVLTRNGFPDVTDKKACIAAYEAHNAHVRKHAPRARFVDWQAEDGWAPLCTALGLPIPDAPFPHANTTAEFQARQVPDVAPRKG